MLSQLNSFADNLIATVQSEIRWFARMKKMLVPFIIMILAFALAFKLAMNVMQDSAEEHSFFYLMLHFSANYIAFNLVYCPAVIIINLWILYLLKQKEQQQPIQLWSALVESIGFKFIWLTPFIFVWMFFQLVFLFFFVLIGTLAALSRGSAGGGAMSKLIGGIASISIMLEMLLFVVTPGMVFDDLGFFSSFGKMRGYMSAHYKKISEKVFHYLIPLFILYYLIGVLPGKLFSNLRIDAPYYTGFVAGFIVMAFVFLIQIKAGQFYLWCKQESQQSAQSASSLQQTVVS